MEEGDISDIGSDGSPEASFATAPSPGSFTSPISSAAPIETEIIDEIILISSDGLTFTTSRTLLIKHSTFFAGLLSLPTENQTKPLELPSATSAGLGLILGVMACVDPFGSNTRGYAVSPMAYKYWMEITVDDVRVIAEATICADAYNFLIFTEAFVLPVLRRLKHQPMIGFALAAVTDTIPELATFAAQTLKSTNPPTIPTDIRCELARFAPNHLASLLSLYNRYPAISLSLHTELRSTQPILNDVNGYAIRCRGGKAGYTPCVAFFYQGKWKLLRVEVADAVFKEITENQNGPTEYHSIKAVVEQTVKCDKCASRLARTFALAVARYTAACNSF